MGRAVETAVLGCPRWVWVLVGVGISLSSWWLSVNTEKKENDLHVWAYVPEN